MSKNCDNCIKNGNRTELDKENMTRRLNIIEGQIRGINKMIAEDRNCNDLLTQLSAVERSLKSISNEILKIHMKTCVTDDIKNGDTSSIDEVVSLMDKLNK